MKYTLYIQQKQAMMQITDSQWFKIDSRDDEANGVKCKI